MNTELQAAMKILAAKVTADVKADDALKYTQAALNLAHVVATFDNLKKQS